MIKTLVSVQLMK